MRFTFERTTLTMLLTTFVLVAVMTSLVLFVIVNQEAQQQMQQQRANQTGMQIIKQIFDKLDNLHTTSQKLINAQGNLSQHTRDVLIQEFASIANKGGFATGQGQQQLLNNVTALLHGGSQPTLAAKLSMQNQILLKDILGNMTINKTK